MTTQTQTDLQEFHEYIAKKLRNGGANLSPEQVLAMWREWQASVKAIQEALDDLAAGDEGVPVDDVIAELLNRIHGSDKK